MEPLYDDYLDDAFHTTLLQLKDAVAEEMGADLAVPTIARWCGRKPSTVYNWMESGAMPGSLRDALRLVMNSARAGYPHFIEWLASGKYRFAEKGLAFTNASLNDELRRSQSVWAGLLKAEEDNNGAAIISGARELHAVAESVEAEGRSMIAPEARLQKNGIRVLCGADGGSGVAAS